MNCKLTTFISVIFILFTVSCSNDEESFREEVKIIDTFPKMYLYADFTGIINSREVLEKTVGSNGIKAYKLDEIDFNRYTLLLGKGYHNYVIGEITHQLYKNGKGALVYDVICVSTVATAVDDFNYGIIVDKLPENSDVKFLYKVVEQ